MNGAKKEPLWWENRPKAGPAIIEKLFELASIPFGMMDVEDAEDWKEWLERVRPLVVLRPGGGPIKSAQRARALAVLRATGGAPTARHCGVCGITGHNGRTRPNRT
jgi:hypothetical protein